MTINQQRIEEFLGAFPDEFIHLSDDERHISAQIYRLLVKGDPVPVEQLAATLDLPVQEVQGVIGQWSGIYFDDDNAIIGYWGLGLKEMDHRFEVEGVNLYTWCAWDSLFIPRIIGKTAHVVSLDPVSKNQISITVTPDGIVSVHPGSAVTSFMVPDTDEIRSDVIKSFCHYLHFFESEESAGQWIGNSDKSDDLVILSIAEGYRIGAEKNDLQYGDALNTNAAY